MLIPIKKQIYKNECYNPLKWQVFCENITTIGLVVDFPLQYSTTERYNRQNYEKNIVLGGTAQLYTI